MRRRDLIRFLGGAAAAWPLAARAQPPTVGYRSSSFPDVNAVWVVTASSETRVERLIDQRGLRAEDARQRVTAQNPEEEKVRRADVVLSNDGSLEDLRRQVVEAWRAIPK